MKHFVFYPILHWNIYQFVILFIFTWSKLEDTGLLLTVQVIPVAFWIVLFCPRLQRYVVSFNVIIKNVLFKCCYLCAEVLHDHFFSKNEDLIRKQFTIYTFWSQKRKSKFLRDNSKSWHSSDEENPISFVNYLNLNKIDN